MTDSHDSAYKQLFSHPAMVRDLLTGFVAEDWVDQLDFTTLEKFNGHYVTDDLRHRQDDLVWRVRHHGKWLYVYLLLEFQRSNDHWMALRLLVYVGLLYQDLIKTRQVRPGDRLPPVFPLVIYNGLPRWTAPLRLSELIARLPGSLHGYQPEQRYFVLDEGRSIPFAQGLDGNRVASLIELEGSPAPEAMPAVIAELRARLGGPEHASLRRAFTVWLNRIIMPRYTRGEPPAPETQDLEEVETMLAERMEQWTRKWKREGLEEGRKEGRQEGHKEGRKEGRKEGQRQGQLTLITHLLTHRFGPLPEWAAARLAAADTERLQSWAEAIFEAQSLEELLGED